jgi:hypothetical protein
MDKVHVRIEKDGHELLHYHVAMPPKLHRTCERLSPEKAGRLSQQWASETLHHHRTLMHKAQPK